MEIYNVNSITQEDNECFAKGICNVNPTLSSIHEIILIYLSELSFYLTKLKEFGIENKSIKETFSFAFFNIVTNIEYNQEQFHSLISKLYNFIFQSKAIYEKYCIENNLEIKTKKSYFKYSKDFTIADAIRKGEKYFIKKSQGLSHKQKNLFDIMLFLSKSLVIKMVELERLGKDNYDAYYAALSMLSKMNVTEFSEDEIKNEIDNFIIIYYETIRKVYYSQVELYGKNEIVDVPFTPVLGKAILVSGSDLKKLELVLKATEGTEIGVYTHGLEMLMAHSFPKLGKHPNLKGHFGSSMESSLVDFASFPGPILMTRATLQRVEYFYRGRLFTLDDIAPFGVIKIKDFNFEPLIKSAMSAKGFTHPQHKPSIKVGYDDAKISALVDDVLKKIDSKKIKHIFVLGLLTNPNPSYNNYFEKFFDMIPDDAYIFSLSYKLKKQNVFCPEAFCDYTLFYIILKKMQEKMEIKDLDISVFLSRCDKHTISNLLYLKHIGIKNLYMCKCPASLINPNIIETLQEIFQIKEFSEPASDINEILSS